MHELLFVIVFIGTLALMGITIASIFVAVGLSLALVVILGMLGAVFKLLPWLIVIALIVYFVKRGMAR
jgi:phage shock protein G